MNPRLLLLVTALAGGLCTTATAATFQAPAPAKVVAPTQLPRSHIGAIVTVKLTIDAAGRPEDIKVLWEKDPRVVQRLVEAIAQWEFTPARENGIAVRRTIELPIELTEA
jgi:protein TonB